MGLQPSYLDYIQECVNAALGDLGGERLLELGDQVITTEWIPEATGKEYYENRGVLHTSFDLNGNHGALRVNLSKPIRNPDWLGAFDIVTNAGTSEHIEPFKSQYRCFMNIHNCLRQGGIAVHLVPDIVELEQRGHWKNHCNYYYSHEFFALLAELNGYALLSSKVIDGLRCVCLRKDAEGPFTPERDALLAAIAQKKGGTVYPGINDHPMIRPFTWVLNETRPMRQRFGLTRSSFRDFLASARFGPLKK